MDPHTKSPSNKVRRGPFSSKSAASEGEKSSNVLRNIPFFVFYGSNGGSSEEFARCIVDRAKNKGLEPHLDILDYAVNKLPEQALLIIVTASYEGQPTDDAKAFVKWLEQLPLASLSRVKYCVFGCGNRNWAKTYQAIPRRIDKMLADAGGARLIDRGEADARGDFFGDFEQWHDQLWKLLDSIIVDDSVPTRPPLNWV